MSAALDVTPMEDRLAHLRRDHITHGYVSHALNEPRREMRVALDNVTDLERYAAVLRLARVSNQWSGWYGEIWLILSLDVPRGIHGAPTQRTAVAR